MYPVLLRLGNFRLSSYGVMFALAFLGAIVLALRRAGRAGIGRSEIVDLSLVLLVSAIVGARAAFIFTHWGLFTAAPIDTLARGGLVFFGGLILAVAAGIVFIRARGLPIFDVGDAIAPSIPLGHALGRIGCFLNGDSYGIPTSLPWGVKFPHLPVPVHPTQLYSFLANMIIFAVLIALDRRRKFKGQVFLSYFLLYPVARFFIEIFRADRVLWGVLTAGQWISLGVFSVALGLMVSRAKTREVVEGRPSKF
ncbi:MAG: prolipoprotein diacylglyceryl transferase [bacterium]